MTLSIIVKMAPALSSALWWAWVNQGCAPCIILVRGIVMEIIRFTSVDALEMNACVQCGSMLLEHEGIKAVISGTQELFCKGHCIGQRLQQHIIAYR